MSKVAHTCEQTCPELWVKVPKGLDEVWAKQVSCFDANETAIIMQSNRQFEQISPIKQCFLEVFTPKDDPEEREYMMAAAIFDILKQKFGSTLLVSCLQRFGSELQNIDELKSKKNRFGTEYLVVRK